jgi:hypothetical protein
MESAAARGIDGGRRVSVVADEIPASLGLVALGIEVGGNPVVGLLFQIARVRIALSLRGELADEVAGVDS